MSISDQFEDRVDEVLSLRDVSRQYKHPSYWTWLRLVHAGELPTVHLPSTTSKSGRHGRILVRRSDVERLLRQYRETADMRLDRRPAPKADGDETAAPARLSQLAETNAKKTKESTRGQIGRSGASAQSRRLSPKTV